MGNQDSFGISVLCSVDLCNPTISLIQPSYEVRTLYVRTHVQSPYKSHSVIRHFQAPLSVGLERFHCMYSS